MTNQEAHRVIELCLELLSSPDKWKKNAEFDEECLINADSFSLACALKLMQLSVVGKMESRNIVMRRVRTKIRWHFLFRQFWHPIHNFSTHPKTTYEDVIFLLNKVKDSFEE